MSLPAPLVRLARRLNLDLLRVEGFGGMMAGQAVYVFGTIVFMTANRWLIYDVSESDALLGTRSLIAGAVMLLCGPFCGVLGDRYGRLPVLRVCASAQGLVALALAGALLCGMADVWLLLTVAGFNALVMTAFGPALKGLLPRLAGEARTSAALALNAIIYETNRAFGPAFAGLLIALAGTPSAFLLLPLASLFFLWRLRQVPRRFERKPAGVEPLWRQWSRGFTLAKRNGLIPIFGLLAFGAIARAAVIELLPSLASLRFGGEAEAYGLLMSAFGLGALVGSIFLLSRRGSPRIGQACLFQLMMAGAVIALGASTSLSLSLAINVLCGFAFMTSVLQMETRLLTGMPDANRSLISSVFSMCNLGATSLAAFTGGWIAEATGMPLVFGAMGAISILGTLMLISVANSARMTSSAGRRMDSDK